MFTGIIEEKGRVAALEKNADTGVWSLRVATGKIAADPATAIGDSVAVNGCCLTVVAIAGTTGTGTGGILSFDVLDETLRATSFRRLADPSVAADAVVNLERALSPTARMGGHFVSGHVDAAGEIVSLAQEGANHRLRVRPPVEFLRYVVYKGSVAVDGISLTVADVDDDAGTFDIWLIPHTLAVTNLGSLAAGDLVNLEFDLLAKYVEKLCAPRLAADLETAEGLQPLPFV
ncbi:MAG: riboflavin synthase [Puniceicoccales bacterium]|jgi:riboflavin synthase|nr:riboflavin synthase [Puniceicoccales bacterium]